MIFTLEHPQSGTPCFLLACFLLIAIGGCHRQELQHTTLTLATTTSTRDSGLLDDLLPVFQEQTGIEVKVIAVGTGQALEIGRRGDADVLLTHARAAEDKFVREGHGERRIAVMANDFVLLGPASDPARIRGMTDIVAALKKIAASQSTFVSRGDRSGTHMKELQLWQAAGVEPAGEWYLEAGQGMAGTLRIADNKQAYSLSDRSTFLAHNKNLSLVIAVQSDPRLRNEYAVIVVNPRRHPHVNVAAAKRFVDFLLAPATQQRIAQFGIEQFGEPLFFPKEQM